MIIHPVITETMKANAKLAVYHCDFDAVNQRAYIEFCTYLHWRSGACILFVQEEDVDYGKPLVLSISFREPKPDQPIDTAVNPNVIARLGGKVVVAPFDQAVADVWI